MILINKEPSITVEVIDADDLERQNEIYNDPSIRILHEKFMTRGIGVGQSMNLIRYVLERVDDKSESSLYTGPRLWRAK